MQSFIFRPRRKEFSLSSSSLLVTRAFDLVNRSAQSIENLSTKNNTSDLRLLHNDGRRRLSEFWAPTRGIKARGTDEEENSTWRSTEEPSRHVNRNARSIQEEDSLSRLISGGFVTQSHAGIFHFLPLGLRVQEKIERLLDKHMAKIGASKVSLSTFSTENLWEKSGRLEGGSSELFKFQDRKQKKFLLSPTHEEEITTVVGGAVHSYKELPLRLYQITRKYRDELRPRQGLLRTREFLMKDLYTFDSTKEKALETYDTVRRVYRDFFNEFKIPYLVAEAESGTIGGTLSHEFQVPSPNGEDNTISCTSCSYVANEELAVSAKRSTARHTLSKPFESVQSTAMAFGPPTDTLLLKTFPYKQWTGVSKDRDTTFKAVFPAEIEDLTYPEQPPRESQPNLNEFRKIFTDLDLGVENYTEEHIPRNKRSQLCRLYFDYRLPKSFVDNYIAEKSSEGLISPQASVDAIKQYKDRSLDLIKIQSGDPCPNCSQGTLHIQRTVELGHTFHLGTRYSRPLNATFTNDPNSKVEPNASSKDDSVPIAAHAAYFEMGCHGIGVSRLIATIASVLSDSQGLNWPRCIAPFEVVIIPTQKHLITNAASIYDLLSVPPSPFFSSPSPSFSSSSFSSSSFSSSPLTIGSYDAIIDDRTEKDAGWKLKDADLIGYPIIIVLGKSWRNSGGQILEVQCRRLGVKKEVSVQELRDEVGGMLAQL